MMWAGAGIALAAAAGAITVCVLLLWLLSIALHDVSIVDIFWGPGFVVAAWVAHFSLAGATPHGWVVAILTSIWGLRLGVYLLWRNAGHGEDPRYTAFINHLGPEKRHWISLTRVFGLQGIVMWVVAWPVILAQVGAADVGQASVGEGLTSLSAVAWNGHGNLDCRFPV